RVEAHGRVAEGAGDPTVDVRPHGVEGAVVCERHGGHRFRDVVADLRVQACTYVLVGDLTRLLEQVTRLGVVPSEVVRRSGREEREEEVVGVGVVRVPAEHVHGELARLVVGQVSGPILGLQLDVYADLGQVTGDGLGDGL